MHGIFSHHALLLALIEALGSKRRDAVGEAPAVTRERAGMEKQMLHQARATRAPRIPVESMAFVWRDEGGGEGGSKKSTN